MKKKLLSLALSMALLISLVSVGGFSIAAEPVDFGSKAWENFENMTEEQADSFFEGADTLRHLPRQAGCRVHERGASLRDAGGRGRGCLPAVWKA